MGALLHITNGDGAGDIIKASAIGGDVLPWRDPMHHGPFPAELDLDALGEIRASYLAGAELDAGEVRLGFRLRNDHLRAAARYEEVVLWFEHDLLDQLQILELLNWFGAATLNDTRLALICVNAFPGVEPFRGIGQLDCAQMASLWPGRKRITEPQIQLAQRAWAAFRSPDPRDLQRVIDTGTSALPYLNAALRRHLQEYPWVNDGLTRTERQILTLIEGGCVNPGRLFVDNMALEDALYIGDWSTYRIISNLCRLETPLLCCAPEQTFRHPPADDVPLEEFRQQELSLTKAGRDVLSGKRHAGGLVPRDTWLGGVQLQSDDALWMWSETDARLVRVEPH